MSRPVSRHRVPRLRRTVRGWVDQWNRIGTQTEFYRKTLTSVGDALVNYRVEVWRLIAQMSLGTGALVLIGVYVTERG